MVRKQAEEDGTFKHFGPSCLELCLVCPDAARLTGQSLRNFPYDSEKEELTPRHRFARQVLGDLSNRGKRKWI